MDAYITIERETNLPSSVHEQEVLDSIMGHAREDKLTRDLGALSDQELSPQSPAEPQPQLC